MPLTALFDSEIDVSLAAVNAGPDRLFYGC